MKKIKKNAVYAAALSVILLHTACSTPKKATYDFPAEMLEAVKTEYTKQCDKGQILYNINCAGCHNVKIGGRMTIPDFRQEQLVGYGLRVSNMKHETGIEEEKVSTEELGLIMTFLSYKKKNADR